MIHKAPRAFGINDLDTGSYIQRPFIRETRSHPVEMEHLCEHLILFVSVFLP